MGIYLLVGLMGIGVIATLGNWRSGPYWIILLGTLQDPIRKLTPGTPPELVLASVPVYLTMIVVGLGSRERVLTQLQRDYPYIWGAFGLFIFTIGPSLVNAITYGPGTWKIALLGLFFYVSPFVGVALGHSYLRSPDALKRLAGFYCVITAIALIGVALEYSGAFRQWSVLGTAAIGAKWVRYRGEVTLDLFVGFYRSPDVMGWHAATCVLLALALALGEKGGRRICWTGVAGWAIFALILCGRRKMALIVPISLLLVGWLVANSRGRAKLRKFLGLGTAVCVIIAAILVQTDAGRDYGDYYFTGADEISERTYDHGVDAVRGTVRYTSGLFGLGVGFSQLGARYVAADRPRVAQEGGLAKLTEEIGLLGLAGFAGLGVSLLVAVWKSLRSLAMSEPTDYLYAMLGAMFVSNGLAFVVSGHIFNDPFINCLFSLFGGIAIGLHRFQNRYPPSLADLRFSRPTGFR